MGGTIIGVVCMCKGDPAPTTWAEFKKKIEKGQCTEVTPTDSENWTAAQGKYVEAGKKKDKVSKVDKEGATLEADDKDSYFFLDNDCVMVSGTNMQKFLAKATEEAKKEA